MKKTAFIILIVISICAMSGCIPHTELDRCAIVEAVGIDYDGEKYTVSVQYFNMDAAGGTTLVDNTKPNVIVVSGSGSTIGAALGNASFVCGKSFMQGITGLIVIGRNAAEKDLSHVLSFASSHYQSDPRALVAVADGKAEDVMNVKFKEGSASADKMEMLFENAKQKGLCAPMRLSEIMVKLSQPTKSVVIPLIRAKEDGGDFTDDGKNITITGGALFTDGKMCAVLSPLEASGFQFLSGSSEAAELTVKLGSRDVTVTLYNVTTKITPSRADGKLALDIHVSADGKYVSGDINDPIEKRDDIARLCGQHVSHAVSAACEKLLTGFGADAADIKYAITSRSHTLWRQISGSYRKTLKNAAVFASCSVDIKRFGITKD